MVEEDSRASRLSGACCQGPVSPVGSLRGPVSPVGSLRGPVSPVGSLRGPVSPPQPPQRPSVDRAKADTCWLDLQQRPTRQLNRIPRCSSS